MKKIAVVYWSGTGNTEKMAEELRKGAMDGGVDADLLLVGQISLSNEIPFEAFALGCPAMGNEVLEETEMEPFIQHLESQNLQDLPVALFGSYDWGDGQWMRDWEERLKKMGIRLIQEGLIIQGKPDQAGLDQCRKLGKQLAIAVVGQTKTSD